MRKSFTLLEVVIAMALIAVCAPVLFTFSFRVAKKEIDDLFLLELERVADMEWNSMKIDLLSHKTAASCCTLSETKKTIILSKHHQRIYTVKKEICDVKEKKISSSQEGKLLKGKISFNQKAEKKQTFAYRLAMKTETLEKK